MQETTSTGIGELDQIIKGYPKDGITTIYGKASSGKTNITLISAMQIAKLNKKIIIIKTEGEIVIDRIKQLSKEKELIKKFIFLTVKNFEEQDKKISKLTESELSNIGMIIFDSSNKLLRLDKNQGKRENYKKQLKQLKKTAREKKIPILMTAQIYSSYETETEEIFAGSIIKEESDCLIELKVMEKLRKLKIKKHNNIKGEKEMFFKIEKEKIKGFIPQ